MKPKSIFQITFLLLLFSTCFFIRCKKAVSSSNSNLLDGAVFYKGPYPSLTTVTYMDGIQTLTIKAYAGQVIVYFKSSITETEAVQIIQTNGGTILAKFPIIGYYLINTSIGSEGSFIASIISTQKVFKAFPHSFGYPGSDVTLFESCSNTNTCSNNHCLLVKNTLQQNGGTMGLCIDIPEGYTNPQRPFYEISLAIFQEAIRNDGRTTLINLSTYGSITDNSGQPINGNGANWFLFDDTIKKELLDKWYVFMENVLTTIASLSPEYQKNFVITICSGNNNMPICDLIAKLKATPLFLKVLKNNVLVVSTTRMNGNYCLTDNDVAYSNNPQATGGTSLAAPAAMAIIQKVINNTGLSAHCVLLSVKNAVALNSNHEIRESEVLSLINNNGNITITDIDGNVYNVVNICDQCWIKENLKTTHYNNGNVIPTGLDSNRWRNDAIGAYSIYDSNATNNNTFGKLYNWYAVNNSNGLCPQGWHIPTDEEWTTLTDYLGGEHVAGGPMKATILWNPPNNGATNSIGFTALPGGFRSGDGGTNFVQLGTSAFFWSSTTNNNGGNNGWNRILDNTSARVIRNVGGKRYGFSCRCVKD